MKRGQAPLISHTFAIAFTIAIVMLIVISSNNIRNDYEAFAMQGQINILCITVKSAIEKIYWPFDREADGVFGRITIDLPEKIGENNYRARFYNNSLLIESDINSTCYIGFNASGSTSGGRTEITWTRTGNEDKIVMVKK
jgi:hypothetical protein